MSSVHWRINERSAGGGIVCVVNVGSWLFFVSGNPSALGLMIIFSLSMMSMWVGDRNWLPTLESDASMSVTCDALKP